MTTSPVASSIPLGLRAELENASAKLLGVLSLPNIFVGSIPPFNSQSDIDLYLTIYPHPDGSINEVKRREGWFVQRLATRHPDSGSFSRYFQHQIINITGLAWHDSWEQTYRYLQLQTDLLQLTLEKNKGYVATSGQIINISSRFSFGPAEITTVGGTRSIELYRSETTFTLETEVVEISGRSVS